MMAIDIDHIIKGLERPVLVLAALMFISACQSGSFDDNSVNSDKNRPNVLLIVADDMGYNELGAWGSEINTPNLDALAFGGLRFTNFHAAPVCAVARAMLLSGATNHLAGMGSMNLKRAYDNGTEPDPGAIGYGLPGYEGHLSASVAHFPRFCEMTAITPI